jgi:hypothetical protein
MWRLIAVHARTRPLPRFVCTLEADDGRRREISVTVRQLLDPQQFAAAAGLVRPGASEATFAAKADRRAWRQRVSQVAQASRRG